MNMHNDYNMSQKTNGGQAKKEAKEVKSCQVQLEHLKSLASRADKVQFVQHISSHLSHMCSPLSFQHHFFMLSHANLGGKDVLDFHLEIQFIQKSHQLPSLLMHVPKLQGISVWKKRIMMSVCFSFLSVLPSPFSLSFCWTHTETHMVVLCGERLVCHPVRRVFLSV